MLKNCWHNNKDGHSKAAKKGWEVRRAKATAKQVKKETVTPTSAKKTREVPSLIKAGYSQDGTKLWVQSPYNPDVPVLSKNLGGKWDAGNKVWVFDARLEDKVRQMFEDVYGMWTEPIKNPVNLIIYLDEVDYGQSKYIAGRLVATRFDRDSNVRLGDGVILLEGKFSGSGGSVKYPQLQPAPGTVLEMMDVPKVIAEKLVKKNPKGYKIDDPKIKTNPITTTQAKKLISEARKKFGKGNVRSLGEAVRLMANPCSTKARTKIPAKILARKNSPKSNPWTKISGGAGNLTPPSFILETEFGQYNLDPIITEKTMKLKGYEVYFVNTKGVVKGALWQKVAKMMPLEEAKKIAIAHYQKYFSRGKLKQNFPPESEATYQNRLAAIKERISFYASEEKRLLKSIGRKTTPTLQHRQLAIIRKELKSWKKVLEDVLKERENPVNQGQLKKNTRKKKIAIAHYQKCFSQGQLKRSQSRTTPKWARKSLVEKVAKARKAQRLEPARAIRGKRSNPANLTVANTILQQLGGRRFTTMVGAKNLVGGDNYLQFWFKMFPKANICKITLTPNDLYNMEFYKSRGADYKLVKEFESIYSDQLTEIFERFTGLRTKLNPVLPNTQDAIKIYDNVLAIEAKKGNNSHWPKETFRHDFKINKGQASIYGLPDGSLLIKGKKRLWKNFNY